MQSWNESAFFAPQEEIEVNTTELTEEQKLFKIMKDLPTELLHEIAAKMLEDPVLNDIKHEDIDNWKAYDIEKLMAKEQGKLITIFLRKHTGEKIQLNVSPDSTIDQLQGDIKLAINEKEEKLLGKRKISWKYVWKNYCLAFGNTRLLEKSHRVMEYGIENGNEIHFAKYKKPKN